MWTWDERKRQANLAKHGVDFAIAPLIDWSRCKFGVDARRDYGEVRIRATGPIGQRLHVMIYTLRADAIRVISLRRANVREYRQWITLGE